MAAGKKVSRYLARPLCCTGAATAAEAAGRRCTHFWPPRAARAWPYRATHYSTCCCAMLNDGSIYAAQPYAPAEAAAPLLCLLAAGGGSKGEASWCCKLKIDRTLNPPRHQPHAHTTTMGACGSKVQLQEHEHCQGFVLRWRLPLSAHGASGHLQPAQCGGRSQRQARRGAMLPVPLRSPRRRRSSRPRPSRPSVAALLQVLPDAQGGHGADYQGQDGGEGVERVLR